MRRIPFALFALVCVTAYSQTPQRDAKTGFYGHFDKDIYVSPTGAFKFPNPVLVELGGIVADTPNVVIFQDDFSTLISIGAFRQDATQRWQLSTRGLRDYLIYFFGNFLLPDFRRSYPKTEVESSARFLPTTMGGALVAYILLPGGSMFADRPEFVTPQTPLVAKRGNMIFVKNGFTFVISTELAERITERTKFNKTPAEEDAILRNRLVAIASKIIFTTPPPEEP